MLTNEKVIRFINNNKALTLKGLEEEANLSHGMLNKVMKGSYTLNDSHLQRIEPVLRKYGYQDIGSASRTYVFANQKGGVAKTTSAAAFAAALSRQGKKVLMVDFDPQANLTAHFGKRTQESIEKNIYRALKGEIDTLPIVEVQENLWLVPSNISLAAGEYEFYSMDHTLRLKEELDKIKDNYDFLVMDTGPSLGALMGNALAASDRVVITMSPEPFPVDGLEYLLSTVNKALKFNNRLQIEGILLTQVDKRTSIHKQYTEQIRESYPFIKIFESAIPLNVSVKESQHFGQDLYTFMEKSNVAQAYLAFTEEVLNG